MTTVHDFAATTIDGTEQHLSEYRGRALLVVNTASQCGFTPQYAGLQELHERYADRGLAVLGFPCDQFGRQEPGSDAEIASFCELSFGITFPMYSKIKVNGANAHPLYVWLKEQKKGLTGGAIKWNFTKFLIDPDGNVVKRYGSTTKPSGIAADIEALLPG